MMEDYKIAIFTPTYNRSKFMPRLFDQLEKQTDKNFVWYIIDDGSSDDTEDVVRRLINTTSINVKYYKKENGGKHSAFNYFIDKVEEKFSVIALDSDDNIVANAVKRVKEDVSMLSEDECGVVYVNKQKNRQSSFRYNTEELIGKTLHDAVVGELFQTECTFVFRTDYLKQFKYPIVSGENFMTEAYMYIQMHEKMKWSNEHIEYGQALDDGLEKRLFKLYKNNPVSWKMFNDLRIENTSKQSRKIKYRILSSAFWVLSKEKAKKCTSDIIFAPFGCMAALYILVKARDVK